MATERSHDHDVRHQHQHPHQHHPAESEDSTSLTEKNRAHWDQFAAHYNEEQWQKDLINDITEFILSNVSWLGVAFIDPSSTFERSSSPKSVRVLDYACGPGTVTNALHGRATEFIGIDLSTGMVNVYNARFAPVEGAESVNAHAVVADLLDVKTASPEAVSGPEFFDFDLAIVGLGYHHFENLEEATKRLVSRVKSGGVFAIIDFLPHQAENTGHPAQHTVAHYGFGEERVREIFGGAGLADIQIVKMDKSINIKGLFPRHPFMARGKKPIKKV